MEFNGDKFALLRYGTNERTASSCHSPNEKQIKEQQHVRDLGVTMSATGEFSKHIKLLVSKCKLSSSWVIFSELLELGNQDLY